MLWVRCSTTARRALQSQPDSLAPGLRGNVVYWDVFVGRMAIVGPRAQRLDEVSGYDAWHRLRLSVKPGLTGLWQVTARQDPSFETRARLDLQYIDNWSPLLDAKIMLQTIPAVIRSTGE